MGLFQDKTALITGGGSGIGFAYAQALATRGARLAIAGLDEAKLHRARVLLEESGAQVCALRLDVTQAEAWPAAVSQAETALGPVQFLFLNAGFGPVPAPLETTGVDEWRKSFDVNVNGALHGVQACLPGMKARGARGHILFTSSVAGVLPRAGMGAYGAAKAAVVYMAEVLREELRDTPVGVSLFCPSAVRTDFAETSRRHTPTPPSAEAYNGLKAHMNAGIEPSDAAEFAVRGVEENRFYLFSHPARRPPIAARFEEMLGSMTTPARGAEPLE